MDLLISASAPQRPGAPVLDASALRLDDIVLTGCGRAYVFPAGCPPEQRLAGLDHPQFRIGYVERHGNGWQPHDIGYRPVAPVSASRAEALYQLLVGTGHVVGRSTLRPEVTFLGTTFAIADYDSPIVSVYRDKLGSVLVGERRGPRAPRRFLPVGAIWPTGDRVAALPLGSESRGRALYTTHRGAVGAVLTAAGYGRLFTSKAGAKSSVHRRQPAPPPH